MDAADAEIARYMDRYVTCDHAPADDALHQLVSDVQQHVCVVGRCRTSPSAPCRHMFPRPPMPRTTVLRTLVKHGGDVADDVPDDDVAATIQQAHKDWRVARSAIEALGQQVRHLLLIRTKTHATDTPPCCNVRCSKALLVAAGTTGSRNWT
jgi:hypothetical protein